MSRPRPPSQSPLGCSQHQLGALDGGPRYLSSSTPGAAEWPWTSHSPTLGLQLPRPTTPGASKDSSHSWQVVWQWHFPFWGHLSSQVDDLVQVTSLNLPFITKYCFPKTVIIWGVTQHSLLLMVSTPDFLQGKPPPPPQPRAVEGVETMPDYKGTRVTKPGPDLHSIPWASSELSRG